MLNEILKQKEIAEAYTGIEPCLVILGIKVVNEIITQLRFYYESKLYRIEEVLGMRVVIDYGNTTIIKVVPELNV